MAKRVTTQRVGNALALVGLMGLPLLIAFAVWRSGRR